MTQTTNRKTSQLKALSHYLVKGEKQGEIQRITTLFCLSKELTGNEFKLLIIISAIITSKGEEIASIPSEELQGLANLSKVTVRTTLASLTESGLISIDAQPSKPNRISLQF